MPACLLASFCSSSIPFLISAWKVPVNSLACFWYSADPFSNISVVRMAKRWNQRDYAYNGRDTRQMRGEARRAASRLAC